MKKLLSFVLTLAMLCQLVPAQALAEVVEELEVAPLLAEESVDAGEEEPAETGEPAEAGEEEPAETGEPAEAGETTDAGDEDTPDSQEENAPQDEPLLDSDDELEVAVGGEEADGQEGTVEPTEDSDGATLSLQDATTGPYEVWLEARVSYDEGETWQWSDSSVLDPMATYRLRAADDRYHSTTYDWTSAAETLTFTPAPDANAVYRIGHTGSFEVKLNADKQTLDGLFYEENGLELPLPAGGYVVTFTGEDEYSYTSTYSYNETLNAYFDLYTIEEGDSYIFNGFYEADETTDDLIRNSLSVKAQGSDDELGLVNLDAPVDLKLSVLTAAALGDAPTIGSVGQNNAELRMYAAKDGDTNLTLDELKVQLAADKLQSWPGKLWWSGTSSASNYYTVWRRTSASAGTNGTTWSVAKTGDMTGAFAIDGIELGKQVSDEPIIQPGVYFPVLRVNINGELYYYAYNPVEVAHVIDERTDPTIVTTELPAGMRTMGYTATLEGRTGLEEGSSGTMSWVLTSGALPAGLALDASAGTISGTLAADATTQTFTVTLTETSAGTHRSATREYTIAVRDAVSLGSISYTPQGVVYVENLEGDSNLTLHLSVPVSADLTDEAFNLTESDVAYNVYQTARESSTSTPWGDVKAFAQVYDLTKKTLELDVAIQDDTTTVDRIEVNLRLKDNKGNEVKAPNGSGGLEWAILTSTVEEPNITMGSYVRIPKMTFDSSSTNLPTEGRVRLWNAQTPGMVEEQTLQANMVYGGSALYALEPGDYIFTVEGKVSVYDDMGELTDKTKWVDIVDAVDGAERQAGTKPAQYKITVGANDGTERNPRELNITYTDKNAAATTRHDVTVLFQNESSDYEENYTATYEVRWYRRTGTTEETDVLMATGSSVLFGPSAYDLYVEVVPTGRNTSSWTSSGRIKVESTARKVEVRVPRRGLFAGTFTLACESGKVPADGGTWGIIEVQTPLAAGGYSSYNLWATKNAGNTVTINGLTSGSIVTFTPRIELMAGPVSYTVPAETTANFSYALTAPQPQSLITFEGLSFTDVNGQTTEVDLTDGLTGVAVSRVDTGYADSAEHLVPVPCYVADATHIVLQPEAGDTQDYYLFSDQETTYKVTITRRDGTAPDRMGTTQSDVAMNETYTVTLSPSSTTATVTAESSVVSYGYVNVPFSNPAKKLCTLLLYDSTGKLVESGPAGTAEQLRTPFLAAGDYTLYAVDTNYLPTKTDAYQTKNGLVQGALVGSNATRGTSTSLTVTQGKATTADAFAFPTNAGGTLVDQTSSSVTVESAYSDYLSINMHAVLAKGADLGTGAHLEVSTNQPSNAGSAVYMNPRTLNINDRAVNLGQWAEERGDVLGDSSNMNDGDLEINLDALTKINKVFVEFPMDMTLVIPQTIYDRVEASIWLIAGDGTRALVGEYSAESRGVTIAAPEIVAWDSFVVHGEAGPKAQVTVYMDGMRAATTQADAYGYYEAEVTLPSGAKDLDEYTLAASAQWTRKGEAFAAASDSVTCLYSTSLPAVESIVICYQPKAEDDYRAVRLYDRGSQPSKYLTIQRDGHVQNILDDVEKSQFFYLVNLSNGEYATSMTLSIPTSTGSLEPDVTDKESTASGWIGAQGMEASYYDSHLVVSNTSMLGGYQTVRSAIEANQDASAAKRAFVSRPTSMSNYSDEVEISFELAEVDEDAEHINILPASDMGLYEGWTSHKAGDTALEQAQLSSFLGAMGTWSDDQDRGRLLTLSASEYAAIDGETTLDSLVSNEKLAARAGELLSAGGAINEWLLVGGTNASGDEERGLPVHHTVSTVGMASSALKAEVEGILDDAQKVTDAYEAWASKGIEPADESVATYNGATVAVAGGVDATDYLGMPYFIETIDEGGSAQAEWMETFYIEDSGDQRIYAQTFISKTTMRTTYWNERYGQKVTITYELPSNVAATGVLRYADILEQWYYINLALGGGINAGNEAYDANALGLQSVASLAALDASTSDSLSLQLSLQESKGRPRQQSKAQGFLATVAEWKLWWDGNDKPNEKVTNALANGRGSDVADAGNPNSKFWQSAEAQGGTVGAVNRVKQKSEAAVTIGAEGGKGIIKDETSHFVPGAGKAFWVMDHWDWIKKQARKLTSKERLDYDDWKRYIETYGNPRNNKIVRASYLRLISQYDRETLDQWNDRYKKELAAKTKKKAPTPSARPIPRAWCTRRCSPTPWRGQRLRSIPLTTLRMRRASILRSLWTPASLAWRTTPR